MHFVSEFVSNQVQNVGLALKVFNLSKHLAWLVIELWVKDVDIKPGD